MDADEGRAYPRAKLHLPDGQRVQVRATRCRPDRLGRFWYDYALELPTRTDDRRRGPSPTTYLFTGSAPHPIIQPIEGQDYRAIHAPPRQERQRWRLAPAPPTASRSGYFVHRLNCAQTENAERLLTDPEALEMLADPTVAVPCPVCRPETVLRTS
ncbi:hypothetical protein GCM10010211_83610 [Streptomyces albospinus]|uniref:Uncharacterized protein n=1 Tax=Streptomyces albospinus TaxID=285515 RepID=A0ABQ2VSF3_9ACTN|nr:DUF6233 domain-containing protein [Streptomyces albospinus]GGV03622.1 hypothetical protein GCM10010211_83610 [Streptomyces albospinus]